MKGMPVLQSPLLAVACGNENSARLEDVTGQFGLIHIQGEGALDLLAQASGDGPHKPGDVFANSSGLFVALRPDVGVVLASPAAAEALSSRLSMTAGERLIIVDMTHGFGLLALAGPSAASVLSRLCGLNFNARAFPNWHAAQTSLAKVRALIVRADTGGVCRYLLAVDRSHAVYVWETLVDAVQEILADR